MAATSNPTALKRWIARELRHLREQSGYSREDAARAARTSSKNIGHFEAVRTLPGNFELESLLQLYGVEDRNEFFQDLRTRAKKGRDWWINFDFHSDALPEYFELFLGQETMAAEIQSFDAQVLPGLLQTPAYARNTIRGADPMRAESEVDHRVELRHQRQQVVLDRRSAPVVWSVTHEAALRTVVGDVEVMRDQFESLLTQLERPNITLQVLPFSAGAHPGIEGTFTFLAFPPEFEGDPGTVYVDTLARGYYHETSADIAAYRSALRHLQTSACRPQETPALIRQIEKEVCR